MNPDAPHSPIKPRRDLLEILLACGMTSIAAWAVIYALIGHWPALSIEAGFFVVAGTSWLWLRAKPDHVARVVWANIAGVFLTCLGNTLVTGGVLGSGVFLIWALIGPMAAMVFLGIRATGAVVLAFTILLASMVFLPVEQLGGVPLELTIRRWIAGANVLGSGLLCLVTLGYFLVRLEEEQKARALSQQKLEETARLESLATLAGGVAHDFNNVLMALFGNLQLAARELPHTNPVRPKLERALAALDQATGLTHQLLSFSSGGAPVLSTTSIGDTIRESASFVLTGGRARCDFDLPPELWPVEADLGQISRLVQNLAINAAQAMPQGGQVVIRGSNEIAGGSGPIASYGKRFVLIEVQDEGQGISEDERARIFEPFYSTREGNTGLGLTTCFAIVRDHGGHIQVYSQPGEGTTFQVWLPASNKPLEALPTDTSEELACPEDVRGQRILVMDDEPSVLGVLCAMLESLGYQPIGTVEGGETLAAWEQACSCDQPFHAVILDLTIKGGMGGVDTAQQLRARGAEVPIVASSGYANDRVMADFREYGFDAVLRKPYRLDDLAAALSGTLHTVS